jgi:hypothetical protein
VPQASNYDPLATIDDASCTCTPSGNPVADQVQLDSDGEGAAPQYWQSFTPAIGGGLASLTLHVGSPAQGLTEDVDITIREGEGLGGTVLGVQTASLVGAISERELAFDEPVPVAAGRQYTFVIDADPNQDYIALSSADPYAGGVSNLESSDLVFRTAILSCATDG